MTKRGAGRAARRASSVAVILLALTSSAAAQSRAPAAKAKPETYASAIVDGDGHLRITTSRGRRIVVRKPEAKSSFANPVVSADGSAVGAQVEFPNCCTSYDIPLQLWVYARGRVHRFKGIGLAMFDWHFTDDAGTRVAYGQSTVHSACATHYELRDVRTERLVDSAEVPQECGSQPFRPAEKIPEWVERLRASRR